MKLIIIIKIMFFLAFCISFQGVKGKELNISPDRIDIEYGEEFQVVLNMTPDAPICIKGFQTSAILEEGLSIVSVERGSDLKSNVEVFYDTQSATYNRTKVVILLLDMESSEGINMSVSKEILKLTVKADGTYRSPGQISFIESYYSTESGTDIEIENVSLDDILIRRVFASEIRLDKERVVLGPNESYQLNATVFPDNTVDKTISWWSDNTDVATISNDGLITAKNSGTTRIGAYCEDAYAYCEVIVEEQEVPVSKIFLDKSELTLNVDNTIRLIATVEPENATDKTVVWGTSDQMVATVNDDGLVTAKSAGNCVITASCGQVSATCIINVNPVLVTNLNLSDAAVELKPEMEYQLSYTITPDNATDKTVTWYSDNESVATVSKNGLITAFNVGNAIITAKCGSIWATCEVRVTPIYVEKITLNKETLVLELGQSDTLIVNSILPENATDKTVTWDSSNVMIVKVSSQGTVTAVGIGETIVTARCGNISADCVVKVTEKAIPYIELEEKSLTLEVGETHLLKAWLKNSDETEPTFEWTSENESVATVSSAGMVTAIESGWTKICVSYEDIDAYCWVTVLDIEPESITLNKTEITLKPGETFQLVATVLPENTTNKTIEWSSNNDEVAFVSVDGVITAESLGKAEITACCGSEYAVCTVYVVESEIYEREVSEDFTLLNSGLPDNTSENLSDESIYTSAHTGLSYSIMGCFVDTSYIPACLIVNGTDYEGAHISFKFNENCKTIKIKTSSLCSTNPNSAVNVYADGEFIGQYIVNKQDTEYAVDIPLIWQKSGTVYKIESASTQYNQQFVNFSYILYGEKDTLNLQSILNNYGFEDCIVFNLQGMRMNVSSFEEIQNLKSGIYIINGKKVLLK